ncbi:hypothetical protein N9Y26_00745, partial [bacterium]|nr:hypothetical protein [bacterium]
MATRTLEVMSLKPLKNAWVLKDQITLLKAINILKKQGLKNIHVKFVGDGKTKKHCIAYAKTHRLDCEFINELEHDKLEITVSNQYGHVGNGKRSKNTFIVIQLGMPWLSVKLDIITYIPPFGILGDI